MLVCARAHLATTVTACPSPLPLPSTRRNKVFKGKVSIDKPTRKAFLSRLATYAAFRAGLRHTHFTWLEAMTGGRGIKPKKDGRAVDLVVGGGASLRVSCHVSYLFHDEGRLAREAVGDVEDYLDRVRWYDCVCVGVWGCGCVGVWVWVRMSAW